MRTCLGDKAETLAAMRRAESGLAYAEAFAMPMGRVAVEAGAGDTRFEALLAEQVQRVIAESGVDLSRDDTQLVISTTKGNIESLARDCDHIDERVFLGVAAQRIAERFGCKNRPIVISNACISGVSAFVVARQLLIAGQCKDVVVAGCDTLCEFITSGFASFKSISVAPCRPYDARRDGLTLGEAAGAVLLTTDAARADGAHIRLTGGAISNDANHISAPSRTGDGLYYAIRQAMDEAGIGCDDVGFVNAHGTATRYNDEMESKAVALAGLCATPLNSVKGYIGHTLGASGVVEAIICAEELKGGFIFGTKGYEESDTPYRLSVSGAEQSIGRRCCVKTASGFGGCNAAIVLDMEERDRRHTATAEQPIASTIRAEYRLPQSEVPFAEFIRAEFRSLGESNMKFYKMSDMSKALYVAVERLLAIEGLDDVQPARRAIVLANRSASLDADIVHQQILNCHSAEGASPSAFVYTLANVAVGEQCIRHKIQGDNTFFIENEESGLAARYAESLIARDRADAVIYGWCDYLKGAWRVEVKLLKRV